jgi:hypothetical protein
LGITRTECAAAFLYNCQHLKDWENSTISCASCASTSTRERGEVKHLNRTRIPVKRKKEPEAVTTFFRQPDPFLKKIKRHAYIWDTVNIEQEVLGGDMHTNTASRLKMIFIGTFLSIDGACQFSVGRIGSMSLTRVVFFFLLF